MLRYTIPLDLGGIEEEWAIYMEDNKALVGRLYGIATQSDSLFSLHHPPEPRGLRFSAFVTGYDENGHYLIVLCGLNTVGLATAASRTYFMLDAARSRYKVTQKAIRYAWISRGWRTVA